MKITAPSLVRWTGLSAMVAGICFLVLGLLHPPNVLSSVTTTRWTIVHSLAVAMSFFGLLGIMGLYARQVKEAGWLGLAGFLLLIVCWWLQTAFVFAEAFIAPPLAKTAAGFVDGYLGISYGHTGGIDLGALPAVYGLVGILYLLGGLLFGIATLRARVLPRWPAGLLAIAALLTPAAALLPHAIQRLAAIPVALAIAWLGYALFSERREQASDPVRGRGSPQLR